jgi:hypothetical protein
MAASLPRARASRRQVGGNPQRGGALRSAGPAPRWPPGGLAGEIRGGGGERDPRRRRRAGSEAATGGAPRPRAATTSWRWPTLGSSGRALLISACSSPCSSPSSASRRAPSPARRGEAGCCGRCASASALVVLSFSSSPAPACPSFCASSCRSSRRGREIVGGDASRLRGGAATGIKEPLDPSRSGGRGGLTGKCSGFPVPRCRRFSFKCRRERDGVGFTGHRCGWSQGWKSAETNSWHGRMAGKVAASVIC